VDADPAVACCIGPTLLGHPRCRCRRPVHDTEVFGPVATLVPYRDLPHALSLVRRGQGSLVASLYGSDAAPLARRRVELADSHGRVHVISPDVAALHTGHGNVMPQSLHGGPGRAGGGEELGGPARAELLPPPQRGAGQHRCVLAASTARGPRAPTTRGDTMNHEPDTAGVPAARTLQLCAAPAGR
jgi:hypothetical protein